MTCQHCQREITEYSNFCYYCGSRQAVRTSPGVLPRKRLMRSATDVKIAGVCGGLAEYLDSDSTIIRLVWALITLVTGLFPGVIGYFVAWAIMPVAPVYFVAPAPQQGTAPQSAGPA